MKFSSTRNKLRSAYIEQEKNRVKTTRKPTNKTETQNETLTVKENVIYDSGWIKSADGGTLVDDGLRVSNDNGEIEVDDTTVGTYIQLINSNRTGFATKNEIGYNNASIGFRKEIAIPENQLPFVDYAIVVKPIPESEITYLTQYERSVYDPRNLIKIDGDGGLICYAYVSSSTLPTKWDENYYTKGYLGTSKTSKWYDCVISTTNADDGRRYVYDGSLYGVIVEWDITKIIDPELPAGFTYTFKRFQGDGILSVNGNTVQAKGYFVEYGYDWDEHEVIVVQEADTTKTVNLTLSNTNVWVKMDGTRVIDGGLPSPNNPTQIQKIAEDSEGMYYPTARWINPSVDDSEFINKYRVWYSTLMKKQVELSSGLGANWKLTNLPTHLNYVSGNLPYSSLSVELNPGNNPLPITNLDSGYSYDYNNIFVRLGDDEVDSLGRKRYQMNLFKSFLYSARASEQSTTNRTIVDESYTSNGSSYDYDGEDRGTKDLDIYACPKSQIEFKIIVFLSSKPNYDRGNQLR